MLVVEDEDSVRRLVERILEPAGYAVLVADQRGRGPGDPATPVRTIDLLLTDVVMPEMLGPELVARGEPRAVLT